MLKGALEEAPDVNHRVTRKTLLSTHGVIINLQIYTSSALPSKRHKRAIQEGCGSRVRSREGLKEGQK